MDHHSNSVLGAILGTLAGILPSLSINELSHTVLLAIIGGAIGWLTQKILNRITQYFKTIKKSKNEKK